MSMIACCNFPTTLLVLDDDQDLLDNIQYALSGKYGTYKCIFTNDLMKAHNVLDQNRGWTKSLLEKGVSQVYQDDDPSLFSVSLDVSLLKKQIYSLERFKHIAIAIVDYDMPKKNGLEFIREANDPQLKVIMLTGKATQDTVIKAFNDKEIHRYVSKGEPDDYLKKVSQYIKELQAEFFFDFSKFILDSIKESDNKVFVNKSFIDLFNKIVRENEIIEYYLLDESGSFLMLDAAGNNQIWLIIKPKSDISYFYELAQGDSDLPAETLKKLKEHKVLTHFKTSKESTASAHLWHFLEAQPLDKENEFYYAIAKNDKHFQIKPSDIKSYQEFLNQE